jgi:two-component system nitrogen regulation response regulator GlnG
VEAYLSTHFQDFPNGMPPPGLIEVPLLTTATRGNQIRPADLLGLNRNTLRKNDPDLDVQVYRSGG